MCVYVYQYINLNLPNYIYISREKIQFFGLINLFQVYDPLQMLNEDIWVCLYCFRQEVNFF